MSEWKGEMTADIRNLVKTIDDAEAERKEGKKVFWGKINAMDKDINKNHAEMKVLKTKVGFIAAGIGAAVTLAIHWIRKQF